MEKFFTKYPKLYRINCYVNIVLFAICAGICLDNSTLSNYVSALTLIRAYDSQSVANKFVNNYHEMVLMINYFVMLYFFVNSNITIMRQNDYWLKYQGIMKIK